MRSVNIIRAPFAVVPCTVPRTSPARHNACMAHPVRGAHTFLFEPGVWTSTGTLWRADGEPLEAVGRTEIAHRRECWLLSGTLKVLGSPPTEFVHAYWIEPPGPKGASMKWSFENATFGTLKGTFAVIGESILSVYGCETSGYHGSEHLGQIHADHHRSAGLLLLQDQIISSLQVIVERAASAAGGKAT